MENTFDGIVFMGFLPIFIHNFRQGHSAHAYEIGA